MDQRFITKKEKDLESVWRNVGFALFIGLFMVCVSGMIVKNEPFGTHLSVIGLLAVLPTGLGLLFTWLGYKSGKKVEADRARIMYNGHPLLGYVKKIKEEVTGGRNNRVRCLRYTIVYDMENGEGQKEWKSDLYPIAMKGVLNENGFCKIHVLGNEVCLDEDQRREIPVFGESTNYWRHY